MKKWLCCLAALLLLLGLNAALAEETLPDAVFSKDGITVNNDALRVDGNTVTISTGGTYTFSGEAEEGQILAAVAKGQDLVIRLNGLKLTCSTGPALYINAKKAVVEVVDGTENLLADGEGRTSEKPAKTVIFGTDDLTLTGTGSLTVISRLSHAVQCKDDLLIDGPVLKIDSVKDGLRGNDSVTIESGTVSITAEGDGIQSSNESSGKGNVVIHGGVITVRSEKSALQAAGTVQIDGGAVTLVQE